MAATHTISGGKERSDSLSMLLASAQTMFRSGISRAFNKRQSGRLKAVPCVRKIMGSQCMINESGMITRLRDVEGRTWEFDYEGDCIVALKNPHGERWWRDGDGWRAESGTCLQSMTVAVNQMNGEVSVDEGMRCVTYRPDGSTLVVVQERDAGTLRTTTFTEFPTHPRRAFVVVERDASGSNVTWIQDSNAKLFKCEYECGRLARYLELSARPAVVWHAVYDSENRLIGWNGRLRRDGTAAGTMEPSLQKVDESGNRHFMRQDGYRFVLDPSGAAVAGNGLAGGQFQSQPLVSLSTIARPVER